MVLTAACAPARLHGADSEQAEPDPVGEAYSVVWVAADAPAPATETHQASASSAAAAAVMSFRDVPRWVAFIFCP